MTLIKHLSPELQRMVDREVKQKISAWKRDDVKRKIGKINSILKSNWEISPPVRIYLLEQIKALFDETGDAPPVPPHDDGDKK